MKAISKKSRRVNITLVVFVILGAAIGVHFLFNTHALTANQVVNTATGGTYASSIAPQANESQSTLLRTNTDPVRRSYVQFKLTTNQTYTSATFKIFANQNSASGFSLYSINNNWTPSNVTYTNQPTLGAKIGTSGAITKGTYVSVNVSSVVKTPGTYSFALVSNSNTEVSYNNFNATANPPQLIVQYSTTTTPPPPPTSVVRAAFYYPWFPNAWNQQGFDPFTNYTPSLGFYSSSSTSVINQHIAAMQYGHLNAGIISWWGQGSQEDGVVPADLTAANGTGFKWSLYYEPEGTAIVSSKQIASDLSYIKAKYASNPNFLTINGKPVIFVYGQTADTCANYAQPWSQANANEGFYTVLKVFSGYQSCASDANGWHQYGPASATDEQSGYSYSISPGFYKKGEAAPRLPRNLTTWSQNVNSMVASKEPLQLITTFNEWGEGTAVESAQQWTSASGFGSYLDVMHNEIPSSSTTKGDTTPPSTPSNLTANSPSPTLVNLNWGASTDNVAVTGYYVYRNNVKVATLSNTMLSYADDTTQAKTTYSYTVRAFDAAGNLSTASNAVSITTGAGTTNTPPTTPTSLSAKANGSTSVTLTWGASTDSTGVAGYQVYRNGSNTPVDSSIVTGLTYTDLTAKGGTAYTYTVKAIDNVGNVSTASNTASVTTPSAAPPTTPTAVNAVANTATQVTVTWTASTATSGIAKYTVSRGTAVLGTSTTTSFIDKTALPGTKYSYSVVATDNSGNTSASSAAASVTTPSQPDTTPPTAPSGLTATINSPTDVVLSWKASSDNIGVAGYNVYRNGSTTPLNPTAITGLSYSDSTVSSGTSYTYTVKALDAAKNLSAASNTATANTGTPPPPPPSGVCATANATPPATYKHIVWIWDENTSFSGVFGSPTKIVSSTSNSYLATLANACGYSTNFSDNMFGSVDLVSEPHYVAGTSGSNCNSGLTGNPSGSGCITSDSDASASNQVGTSSIFDQLASSGLSWKAYQEGMTGNCDFNSGGTDYAAKHNPPIFFSKLTTGADPCKQFDIPIPAITCSSTSCTAPGSNSLITDINNGTLPSFSFITPNLQNDKHDGSLAQTNQWMQVYLKDILNGPNYKSGNTAVFYLFDENAPNGPQPDIFITPTTKPTATSTLINQFSVLRNTEQMLGMPVTLGCATGTFTNANCPSGSTVDLRSMFNM